MTLHDRFLDILRASPAERRALYEATAARLGSLEASLCPLTIEIPLELAQRREKMENEHATGRRRVDLLGQRLEVGK